MQFRSSYKKKMSPALCQSCFIIMEDGGRVRLQYVLAMACVDHHVSNPPSAAVRCRQPIRCQPSDLVPRCQAPSRHCHSRTRQRPILFARLCTLPQPFVPCHRVVAVKVVSTRQRILLFSSFAVALLPQFCDFHFHCLLVDYLPLLCEYAFKTPIKQNSINNSCILGLTTA